ncbi:hypothetical protein BDN70DRAFT_886009 [Pholiota conissans]|uniref:Uncharacterized protein n=1 Tax=Pholiota conissans TaxID=109636 RepID=A0A9P5YNZ6_9AGAR|nr:hypothetical protein BDN70DRAFT_886009 [Pholiota conissans]
MANNSTEEFSMLPLFTQHPFTCTFSDENESPASTAAQLVDSDEFFRVSEGWLRNPAWIDGGINPPRFYHSQEEINDTLLANGLSPRRISEEQLSGVSPTPALPAPPAPLTRDLVNSVVVGCQTVCAPAYPIILGNRRGHDGLIHCN